MANYVTPTTGIGMTEWINKPCTAHVLIKEVNESPTTPKGELINGIRFRGVVLAATSSDQVGREFGCILRNPDMSKSTVEYWVKCHIRMAVALRMIAQPQPGQPVEINWQAARGRQCMIRFVQGRDRDTKELVDRIEFDNGHFYDVTDHEMAAMPKDQAALMQFGGGGGGGGGQVALAPVGHAPQQQVASAATATDWGSI